MPNVPQLLHGPYRAPDLDVGDRVNCLLRDCACVVTSWTRAPIPWPRVQPRRSPGGSGLLLAGDLVRAVECESALAVGYWWGVSEGVVWRWRKALGIGRSDTEGSRRLMQAVAQKGADAMKAREWSAKERRARRRRALKLDLGRHLTQGYHGPRWTDEQLVLLGTRPDADVAAIVGRTANAVRVMRWKMGIPKAANRKR